MKRSLFARLVPIVAIVLACGWGTARAQGGVARPYSGLFGGGQGGNGQGLGLSVSAFGGYDDNVLADQPGSGGTGPTDPRLQESGYFTGVNAGLSYQRTSGRSTFHAGVGSGFRYYPDLAGDQSLSPSTYASVDLGRNVTNRLSLNVSGLYRYLPYYRQGLLPGLESTAPVAEPGFGSGVADVSDVVVGVDDDFILLDVRSQQWETRLSASHRLSARSTLGGFYGYRLSDFSDAERDSSMHGAGGRYTYRLSPDLSLRAGYGYRVRQYEAGVDSVPLHTIDAGVDYHKALQFGTDRTQVRFGVGSSMFTSERLEGSESTGGDLKVVVTGNANLFHRLSQTWSAQAAYRRGVRFLDGFAAPVVDDTISASVGGSLGPQTSLIFQGAYSFGAFNGGSRGYDTSVVAARLQHLISSNLSAFAQYFYYQYYFEDDVILPPGYPQNQERQGVRVGLSLWLPLLR